ncbi:DUF2478 domain-containing protein [Eikenella sp. S3360]|uniref:DUF2478 domain-containing protein n=1 Tax=Eikenella glucosivorans TaxID=2766967 RepID=A0ABS0N833_9NEIS|nr:DUF2478 domain-containing protein [Eikenella glucosivorans]MBH5328467.1 DUF2478 domain-containing protein [Eikenella glucosivorans]
MTDFSTAAVIFQNDAQADAAAAALWQAAAGLRRQGFRIGGLLNPLDGQGRHLNSRLVSLADGAEFPIFQNLGSGSSGCKLDGGKLAEAGAAVREAVQARADLVFINKFGHAEIENRGLLAEYLAAAAAGIPVLTTVHTKYLPEWRDFCGGEGAELPADSAAVIAWARNALAAIGDGHD